MGCLLNTIKQFRETGDLNYIYKNKLDKVCFAHDTAYSDSKDFGKSTITNKILKDGAYEIAINPKYHEYGQVYQVWPTSLFDEKTGLKVNINEELAQ